jgi:transcriptional regulator of acetoin/glycerol metabolism
LRSAVAQHAQALAATNGNVTAAAKKLGISRRTLHRKINEMNAAKAQGSDKL